MGFTALKEVGTSPKSLSVNRKVSKVKRHFDFSVGSYVEVFYDGGSLVGEKDTSRKSIVRVVPGTELPEQRKMSLRKEKAPKNTYSDMLYLVEDYEATGRGDDSFGSTNNPHPQEDEVESKKWFNAKVVSVRGGQEMSHNLFSSGASGDLNEGVGGPSWRLSSSSIWASLRLAAALLKIACAPNLSVSRSVAVSIFFRSRS